VRSWLAQFGHTAFRRATLSRFAHTLSHEHGFRDPLEPSTATIHRRLGPAGSCGCNARHDDLCRSTTALAAGYGGGCAVCADSIIGVKTISTLLDVRAAVKALRNPVCWRSVAVCRHTTLCHAAFFVFTVALHIEGLFWKRVATRCRAIHRCLAPARARWGCTRHEDLVGTSSTFATRVSGRHSIVADASSRVEAPSIFRSCAASVVSPVRR
jgi:hypothetical protein